MLSIFLPHFFLSRGIQVLSTSHGISIKHRLLYFNKTASNYDLVIPKANIFLRPSSAFNFLSYRRTM